MTIKSHIVQHTHWDREWYFTVEDAKVLSDQVFTEALDELIENPNVNFTLDGQTSILDEYLEINPDRLSEVKKLVSEKRLFIGPWYTQTDALLVDAESILRNLMIGIRDARQRYGEPMMIGYLPDTFGFNAQMPTLLNQVGIDSFIAWRGIDFKGNVSSPYFVWKGLGKKQVYAAYFPYGYMTGLMTLEAIEDIPRFVHDKLDPSVDFLHKHSESANILIPSGIDQKSMILNFDEILSEINEESKYEHVISDYPKFISVLKQSEGLEEYRGDLRLPVYSRVHRTISSVRTRMKIENFLLEQRIIRTLEPLYVIANSLNIYISPGLLDRLWKKVLENQAHDSIGGCVSDNVAEDIFHRIKESNEIAEGIENLILKRISESLDLQENQVLVVNTDPHHFSGLKKVKVMSSTKNIKFEGCRATIVKEKYYPSRDNIMTLVSTGYDYIEEPGYYELDVLLEVEIPALGYKVVEFFEQEEELRSERQRSGTEISNKNITISYENNSINIITKNTKTEDFISLWNQGNDGDTYDFSPLQGDEERKLPFHSAYVTTNEFSETLYVKGSTLLPYNLEDRKTNNNNTEVKYGISISLYEDGRVEGKVFFDNRILSHRLRLGFKTNDQTATSLAQIQNGFVKHQPKEIDENWNEYRVEKPVNIEVFDKSVSVQDSLGYLTVFADGLKEYERRDDMLYITLQATTGELGKPNLAWRPGRASGDTTSAGHVMMPTPLAQEVGEQEYTFSFNYFEGEIDEYNIALLSHRRLHRSLSYQRQKLNKFIYRLDNKIWDLQNIEKKNKKEYSCLELPEDLIVSSIYPSYYGDEVIVRFANPSNKRREIPSSILRRGTIINALEEPINNSNFIEPYDYITLKFDSSLF